jgi:hypothetical protein
MQGKKNNKPAWNNKEFDQFFEDFKADADPTGKFKAVINGLEQERIDS